MKRLVLIIGVVFSGGCTTMQYGQGVAAKVWAAVLALISISLYADKQADDKRDNGAEGGGDDASSGEN